LEDEDQVEPAETVEVADQVEPAETVEGTDQVEPAETVEGTAQVGTVDAIELKEILAAVERLDARLAERDRLAARDRDHIDQLHAENQRLRAGEIFQAIAPVARDLVRLRDQALQLDAASPEPGRSDAALLGPQITQILARLGFEAFAPAEGEPFDATVHQGVGRRTTPDQALDGTVAAVRREGFTSPEGRPLRPAEVEVWRHRPDPPDRPEPDRPARAAEAPYAATDDSPRPGDEG
jgi:molecular chaperone GrpE (heat shock protein)